LENILKISQVHPSPVLPDLSAAYHGRMRIKMLMLFGLTIAVGAAAVIDICVGAANLPVSQVLLSVFDPHAVSRATRSMSWISGCPLL
jgi:iron complex transport system permease protein